MEHTNLLGHKTINGYFLLCQFVLVPEKWNWAAAHARNSIPKERTELIGCQFQRLNEDKRLKLEYYMYTAGMCNFTSLVVLALECMYNIYFTDK